MRLILDLSLVAKLVEKNLCKSDSNEVCKSCAKMWLRYAEFKGASHEYQEAMDAIGKAVHLLSSVQDPIALQRAFEQKSILQYSILQLQIASMSK